MEPTVVEVWKNVNFQSLFSAFGHHCHLYKLPHLLLTAILGWAYYCDPLDKQHYDHYGMGSSPIPNHRGDTDH